MKYYHYLLLIGAFLLGMFVAYLKWRPLGEVDPFAMMNADTKLAACKGISDEAELDVNLFCQFISSQMSQEECLKTEYVKAVARRNGSSFIEECANKN